ncbi:MAG TPA: hypothetical protein HA294_00610 [Nanoarchaeota archaeon]|nr:hypothetical protein [Nanoarchaeota archaeon]
MIQLYFDTHRHIYVTAEKSQGIALDHTTFADVQERIEDSPNLEGKIQVLAEKRFGKDRRKPDAYSLFSLGQGHYALEFIYVTAPFVSLEKKENAAK